MSAQISLLDYEGRVISRKAPEGVKRAGKAGVRVDELLIAWARRNVGEEHSLAGLWMNITAQVECAPDTPRRRLDALESEGLLSLGTPSRAGHVLVTWVRP